MSRNWGTLFLAVCGLLAASAQRPADAQHREVIIVQGRVGGAQAGPQGKGGDPRSKKKQNPALGGKAARVQPQMIAVDVRDCRSWAAVPGDEEGTPRRIQPISFGAEGPFGIKGFHADRLGYFAIPGDYVVALLKAKNNNKDDLDFTVRLDAAIYFHAGDNKRPEKVKVAGGKFMPFDKPELYPTLPPYDCVGGKGRLGKAASVATEASDATSGVKPAAGEKTSTADPSSIASETTAAASVCSVEDLKPLAVHGATNLTSLQMVGRRNQDKEAEGHDYDVVSGDATPLGRTFDIADSAGKLIAYEAVGGARHNFTPTETGDIRKPPMWVSIVGVDASRAKPRERATTPAARTLRMIVVGGAQEIAISGLELVGAELRKPSRNPIGIDVEWYLVEPSGSITRVDRYASFENLVNAARERAARRPLDVLSEAQLDTLLDRFEDLLTTQTRALDKVFWIKGAYAVPSKIAHRFEKFIAAVSSSRAVVQTPAGRPGKWLVVVTAEMPGYSAAYLQEPVSNTQIGDVIIETRDASGRRPRRLIEDVSLLATRLRAGLVVQPDQDPPANEDSVGKLVLDGRQVFETRGYVVTPGSAAALSGHLHSVLEFWNGNAVKPEVLAKFTVKSGKASPTLVDILQGDGTHLRLPNLLPDWARKSFKSLSASEHGQAQAFVRTYAEGADRVVESTKKASAATSSRGCALFYVPDEWFFKFGAKSGAVE
jgi:hypothetical protein